LSGALCQDRRELDAAICARVLPQAVRNVLPDLPSIVVAALIYFLLLWPVVRLLSRLENRALAGQ
jgi:ABC-type amino acid transport system permease subunit